MKSVQVLATMADEAGVSVETQPLDPLLTDSLE
jgi:hypothetical protein